MPRQLVKDYFCEGVSGTLWNLNGGQSKAHSLRWASFTMLRPE